MKNAPVYNGNNGKDISEFVDMHVTCKQDSAMPDLINYQTHRHARTCRKKGKAVCRFNFPLPPMPHTMVLEPLSDEDKKSVGQNNFQKIATLLSQSKLDDVHTFNDLLCKLDMNLDTYITSIQSTLTTAKVFLQRSIGETRINNYNRTLLRCWEANMDIQYILDPYSCVSYIVSYISKGQRGLSNLLYEACKEARAIDSDIRQQVRRIGNQFLSHVEIGAQEAAYLVLQMPLRKASREVVFIDTNKADARTVLLKSYTDLKQLPENSTNVESDSVIKKYKRRPACMNKCCYADFVSWFDTVYKGHKEETVHELQCELPEQNYTHDLEDCVLHSESDQDESDRDTEENVYEFRDGTIMRKRKKQKVIRYHKVNINVDREEHYRQQLMLFTSWRNEDTDLLHKCPTYEESYAKMKGVIECTKSTYERLTCELDEIQGELDEGQLCTILPEVEHQESIDSNAGSTVSETFRCFDPGKGIAQDQGTGGHDYDIGQDLGIARKRLENDHLPLGEMQNDEYRAMVQGLNAKQKEFFYNVLHHAKTKDEPLYTFLTGGAGVGKSVLLRTLYQALLKYYTRGAGENPDDIQVLLCAPTGKAAHNIGGNTIHSTFCIPVGRGFAYKPLDMQQLDTMRCKYHKLKMVFIDEISMVGKNMFNFINLRLQEIKGCTKPFGGISLIAFGDLFQLKPVMDSWIFSQPRTGIACLSANLWQDHFTVFELDEIMRQKDDLSFAQMLNRLREGNQLSEDIDVLKLRQLTTTTDSDTSLVDNLPHLYTKRVEGSLHNDRVLAKLGNEQKITVDAVDNVSGDVSESVRQRVLHKVPDDAAKTMGLEKSLHVGIGLPCELCLNIDVADGLTNGTPCVIQKFDYRVAGSARCSIIWVLFENSAIGVHWRHKYSHLYNASIPRTWTPVLETTRSFSIQHYKTYQVIRRQFPLHMAAGKTIHKAQGSTLQGAVVHFGKKRIDHIHYVGLSRVRNLDTIHILELNEAKITVSDDVIVEMERLRLNCSMKLYLPKLVPSDTNGTMTVCFHNCRSLQKHIDDVKTDMYHVHTDIFALCETRVYTAESKYNIPGYTLFCSDDISCKHGMAIYYRSHLCVLSVTCVNVSGVEVMVVKMGNLNLCFFYCPPKLATLGRMKQVINHLRTVISLHTKTIHMGDFNQDALNNAPVVQYLCTNFNYLQLINMQTTDSDTCIDHIYTNIPCTDLQSYGTLESYYSDHKPIYVTVRNIH